jgi:capsular polysaccharide biosynthesis protein
MQRGINVEEYRQLAELIKKNLILVLFVALLSGAVIFALSRYVITPRYTATASMYVYSNTNRSEITSFELTASQELVNTYIVIIKSDTVLEKVITSLDSDLTPKDLRKGLAASALDATEAFSISFTHTNPKFAQAVTNKIVELAPAEIIRIVKAGGVEVIDYAKEPGIPSSPNIIVNTLVGTLLGFVLTIGICLILKKLDTKIHEERDLSGFKIPVVGVIPIIINR